MERASSETTRLRMIRDRLIGAPVSKGDLDVLQAQLAEMETYVLLITHQARRMFVLAAVFTALGFAGTLAGIALGLIESRINLTAGFVLGIAILSDLVGVFFFLAYRQAMLRRHRLFRELQRLEDALVGLRLAASIEDASSREEAMQQVRGLVGAAGE